MCYISFTSSYIEIHDNFNGNIEYKKTYRHINAGKNPNPTRGRDKASESIPTNDAKIQQRSYKDLKQQHEILALKMSISVEEEALLIRQCRLNKV